MNDLRVERNEIYLKYQQLLKENEELGNQNALVLDQMNELRVENAKLKAERSQMEERDGALKNEVCNVVVSTMVRIALFLVI